MFLDVGMALKMVLVVIYNITQHIIYIHMYMYLFDSYLYAPSVIYCCLTLLTNVLIVSRFG